MPRNSEPKGPLDLAVWHGLGDAVLMTATLRAVRETYPRRRIVLHCFSESHAAVYRNNPHADAVLVVPPSRGSRGEDTRRRLPDRVRFPDLYRLLPGLWGNKTASEYLGELLGVVVGSTTPKIYLDEHEVRAGRAMLSAYGRVIVIHTTSACCHSQEWPFENWCDLVRRNPELTFVQLGYTNERLVPGVVDLRGKTSLREAFAVLAAATAFVGVVSVFAHAAAGVGTRGVVLFGASNPAVWGHSVHVNLWDPPSCAPCFDLLRSHPCPYNSACMRRLSVPFVEGALKTQIARGRGLRGTGKAR